MKILIIGASGFIGLKVYEHLKKYSCYEILGTYFKNKKNESFIHLDISNKKQVEKILIEFKPEVIFWLAGSKNLKECEASLEFAQQSNTYPVQNCLKILKKNNLNTNFIFFSTDYVFNGIKGNFTDSDIPNPKTNYGLSNYLAEKSIISSGVKYTIIRTSAVMGEGGIFFNWLIKNLKKNDMIELFADIFFTPTPIELLNENVLNIIEQNILGIFHICGNQRLSRYEFAIVMKNFKSIFKATLIPSSGHENMSIFQTDLSLFPSKICIQKQPLEEYLREEIKND